MNYQKINQTANKLYAKGDFLAALKTYKKMLNISSLSDLGIVYYNIGLCHFSLFNYPAAEIAFQKSFKHGFLSSGHELSMTKLFLGKLEEGLDLYKWRYYGERFSFPEIPLKKAESIEDLEGRNVIVFNEQGFGDEILFSRAVKMVAEFAKHAKFQVYPELHSIFSDNFQYPNVEFFSERSFDFNFIRDRNCWIPSGDLFVLWTKKYGFDFSPVKIEDVVEKDTVGFCWKANSLSINSHHRSIDPESVKHFFEKKKIFSLQKDESLEWMIPAKIETFQDTLRIIEKVEEVYTIDTSVLHLSLVTKKKTKMLTNGYIDWRWKYPFYTTDSIVSVL